MAYWPSARPVFALIAGSRLEATFAVKITPKMASPAITMPAMMDTPMLIQAMMRVAVLSPAPPTRPSEAAISLLDEWASTRATIAAMMGHTTHDTMARTSPMMALVEVIGPPACGAPGEAAAEGSFAIQTVPSQ